MEAVDVVRGGTSVRIYCVKIIVLSHPCSSSSLPLSLLSSPLYLRRTSSTNSASIPVHLRRSLSSLLPSKIIYIKLDPRNSIRNGFANGPPAHSHFDVACGSRHQSSMVPKALKFATLQKKMAPIPPHT